MAKIPKKVCDRLSQAVAKFQKVLQIAKARDINEADTVNIVTDILAEVFGFDKYLEVTSEYAIRGTYCDLAIKLEDKIQYLIEVKAIGLPLKENHLRQAVDYGANHGAQWVVLTNGECWEIYCIKFDRPISYDQVLSFNFTELNPRKADDQDKLFLLCKEGLAKSAREEYYEKVQSVNRFVLGALILSDPVLTILRREVRKLAPGVKIEGGEIAYLVRTEVLKRDVVDGEEAAKAKARVTRSMNKQAARKSSSMPEPDEEPSEDSNMSFSDKLLQQGEDDS